MIKGISMSTADLDFQTVHDRFRPRVLRYLTRLAGEIDAEDLTQCVMLKISQGLPAFRGDASLATWVYRIATNTALEKLRRKPVLLLGDVGLEGDDYALPDAQVESVETTAIREETSACIREFIERLPENYRTVMVLSELEGFKNGEIASILGVTLDTVKIRLHRGREKLRKELETGCSFHRNPGHGLACDRSPPAVLPHRRGD